MKKYPIFCVNILNLFQKHYNVAPLQWVTNSALAKCKVFHARRGKSWSLNPKLWWTSCQIVLIGLKNYFGFVRITALHHKFIGHFKIYEIKLCS